MSLKYNQNSFYKADLKKKPMKKNTTSILLLNICVK